VDKFKWLQRYMVTLGMLLFIGAIILLNILTPDRTFSDSENRVLEQKPEFSLDTILTGRFMNSYETYMSDQFSLKDYWIGIKTDLERRLGKKEYNGVFLGEDHYLLQGYKNPDEESFKDKMEAFNSFQQLTPWLNKYVMLVPTSTEVLKDKLPPFAPIDSQEQLIEQVKGTLDKKIKFVDVRRALEQHKNEYIYFKTDHHWTTNAAYYAYREFITQTGGKALEKDDFTVKSVTDQFYGSLYSKSGIKQVVPDSIYLYVPKQEKKSTVEYTDAQGKKRVHDSVYFKENLDRKDKYTIFLNGNHPLVKISTNGSGNKKLLMMKDSYANSFIPFLTNHYSEIYVVDLRFYGDNLTELIQKNGIKDILFLYNANTFVEDSSVETILDYVDMDAIEEEKERLKEESERVARQNSTTPKYDFKEYFKQDIFMGDSITEAVSHYGILDGKSVNAKMGININEAKAQVGNIKLANPRNIYLLYGVNDMDDRMPIDWFIGQYRGLVHNLKQRHPKTQIYVQSVLPVQSMVEKRTPHTNNKFIHEVNKALEKMAAEEQVKYVNINQLVSAENQGLYEGDGKHFKRPFYNVWFNYMVEYTNGKIK